jgi:hypothetical protein
LHPYKTWGKIIVLYIWTFGRGSDNPTLEKTLVMNSEEAIAGYFSWQKLLRKARAVETVMMMMILYSFHRHTHNTYWYTK